MGGGTVPSPKLGCCSIKAVFVTTACKCHSLLDPVWLSPFQGQTDSFKVMLWTSNCVCPWELWEVCHCASSIPAWGEPLWWPPLAKVTILWFNSPSCTFMLSELVIQLWFLQFFLCMLEGFFVAVLVITECIFCKGFQLLLPSVLYHIT